MTTVLIAASSTLVVIVTLAWAREFRLRRALQSLLSRVFNHWSSANETDDSAASTHRSPGTA
ncbi:hypothetical protein N9D23_13590, partial [Rubripirellula sp.]|nr:hypothetical protein [Rubripirellula sp.]